MRMIEALLVQIEADSDHTTNPPARKEKSAAQKRGRKAIGLRDYKVLAAQQIALLEARMAQIGDRKSKQWQNMRKQVLMYRLRIKQRQQASYERD
mmetsp:Transcript_3459/g.4585  ORF Transcript_3459/g.4585 Transcript_3459/m.4585 type:complete len:95 (-) Transcript_3459:252-536(-)